MNPNNLYLRNRLHEDLVGTHISMTDSIVSEIIGQMGFDFVWIDSEHSENNCTSIRNHITAINAGGTPAVVRVPRNDYNFLKHILEMGPQGIVFPMVNTPEEAEQCMKFCTYPSYGIRGFGPLRTVRYGLDDMNEYIRKSNDLLCRFIQIETKEAVENLPEILKNPYIDGCIFGPCDLSGSIGKLNQIYDEENIALIRRAVDILRKSNKSIGISIGTTDPEQQRFWYDLGIHMISTGTDYDYILKGAKSNLAGVRRIFSKGEK